MVRRHPPDLPHVWLFSDERSTHSVEELAAQLPPGSGIVLRHDALPVGGRWRLMRRLARIAHARKLVIFLAGDPQLARRWGADGVHLRQPDADLARQAAAHALPVSVPVHDHVEASRARRCGAAIAFVSPLHPTRSHPGGPVLGRRAWLSLARMAGTASVALGGMTPRRARALRHADVHSGAAAGWAAIDHWDEKAARRRQRQKRKAVPT